MSDLMFFAIEMSSLPQHLHVAWGVALLALSTIKLVITLCLARFSPHLRHQLRHMMVDVMDGTGMHPEDYADTIYR